MQSSDSYRRLIGSAFTITGVVVFAFVLFNAAFHTERRGLDFLGGQLFPSNSTGNAEEVSAVSAQSASERYPTILSIPKISVNAEVEHVGTTPSGDMGIPSNFKNVAWYKYGVAPGELGTAVIDGHLDDALGFKAVFGRLEELSYGDEIEVKNAGGETLRFIVTGIDTYDYDDPNARDEIFSNEDTPTLRLITCGGKWIRSAKTYDKRLVVTAVLS